MLRDRNRRQMGYQDMEDSWSSTEPYFGAQYLLSTEIRSVDISVDGLGIRTTVPLDKEKIISFDLCFSHTYHRVVARVLRSTQKSDGWENGLQVLQMPDELMTEIEEYLMMDPLRIRN